MFPPLLLLQGIFLVAVVSSMPVSRRLYGEVSSPNYPKPYPNNNITTWDISVPKGYRVKLNFWHFDLEPSEACHYDYVKIKADKKDLGRYCGQVDSAIGNHPKGREFLSMGNTMQLLFHSDFSNEENGISVSYKGFQAYYQAVDLDECTHGNANEDGPRCQHFCHNYIGGYFCSCQPGYRLQSDRHSCRVDCSNVMFTELSGYLSSPGYPQPYPADLQCNYSIRVEKGLTITLKVLEPFEIDDHQQVHCPYDQLKIQVGGKVIHEFCGTVSPGAIETNSPSVDVLFLTDESGVSRGWKIQYSTERIRCPQPVPNDEFTIIRELQPVYRFQDYFIVSCRTGYNLVEGHERLPSFTAVCQDDGTWHRQMPHCEIVNCGEPAKLLNGAFDYVSQPKNNNYQSTIRYRCNEPYYHMVPRMGTDTYSCSSEGSWKDQRDQEDIPLCLPVCGMPDNPVSQIQRIIGGSDAKPGSFPWQAMTVMTGDALRAGGALLSDRWILTAAHTILPKGQEKPDNRSQAFLKQMAEKAEIFMGHTVVTELYKLGNRPVRRLFIHPDYVQGEDHNFDGDIALIELRDPVTLGPDVLPVCLPSSGNDSYYVPGWMGYASGFGVEKNILANKLKYAPIPVADRELCEGWLRGKQINKQDPAFTINMFCAGSPKEGKDTCQGDSGGALTVRDPETERWVATGIVSWGIGCGKGYGFYTKVMNYLDWIKGIVGNDWLSMQVPY
ncbi:complement C1r subcomponent isoform X2 [Varanus komodoensis]|uniref:complement C1r subcomponent isoform X2 n=1 Tax=Varanus komodoensis TaxID=61221 RepID=UPI001CF7BE81|nr:complement C1r subcomponent isoform X2 [Varanus komodoensis]